MKRILTLLLFVAVLFSCKPKEPARIDLRTGTIECPSDMRSSQVSFSANYDWTATSSVQWINLSQVSGPAGDIVLQFTLGLPELDPREGQITITCGDARQTVTVRQKQLDKLTVDGAKKLVPADAGTFTVNVGSNISYEVSIPADATWVRRASTKAYVTEELAFEFDANYTTSQRQTDITFSGSGITCVLTLYQEAGKPDVFAFSHNNASVSAPLVEGDDIRGTIDWGDGSNEEYAYPLEHVYATDEMHKVVVSVFGATSISLSGAYNVESVDISGIK